MPAMAPASAGVANRTGMRRPSVLERGQLLAELLQAERAEGKRPCVPGPAVEGSTVGRRCRLRGVPASEPGSLAELVGGGLARPREIAQDLALGLVAVHATGPDDEVDGL